MAQLTLLRDRLDPAELRDRLAARARTTPGRLTYYVIVLAVLGALTGLSAVVGAVQRSDAIDAVANSSGQLAVQAQALYRSLSDADATAAAGFLAGGVDPPALRQRYDDDIAGASAALAATVATSETERGSVARIAAALPVYTGLVEKARTLNRQNFPVGAGYLNEASTLMRKTLLPSAQELYQAASTRLADDRSSAASFPWLTIPLILFTLAGLVVAQLYLVRRTQRLVNVGLVSATAAGVVMLLWIVISWATVANNLSASDRDGSAQVKAVAEARIAAQQARADEALTLVARGGASYDDDFRTRMNELLGEGGDGGLLAQAIDQTGNPDVAGALTAARDDLRLWRSDHNVLHRNDLDGKYPEAVALAVGKVGDEFARVDANLAKAIAAAGVVFDERAGSAGNALTAAVAGSLLLTIVMVAGLVVGLEQRIAEYR